MDQTAPPAYPELHEFEPVPMHIWVHLECLFPKPKPRPRRKKDRKGGRPRASDRLAFSAILWRLRSGGTWSRLPERFGSRASALRRLRRWLMTGKLELLFRRYLAQLGRRELHRWSAVFAAQRDRRELFWVDLLEAEHRAAAAARPQKRVENPMRWALPSSPAGEKA